MSTKRATELICPACGSSDYRELYRRNGCDVLRCESCGLGRTLTAAFDPGAYYTKDYFAGEHEDGYADYRGSEAVLRAEFARIVDLVRGYRAGGRLLEIGCAYGFFLQEAKQHFDVAGLEIAEDAVAFCRERGLPVTSGIADASTLAQFGKQDVIVLLDVIEHLPQPSETLAACARQLNPGGIILLTTGDFGSPTARVMGRSWRLMTPPQHLWFFTRESVDRMTRPLGLSIARYEHPWKVVPLSLILFQLRRMFGLGGRSGGASHIGVPVNLFDAMRIVLRAPG